MGIPYFHVDAFTSQPFRGNPAGVCLLSSWLSDETLQRIAAENNLAETAFLVQRDERFDLRWFTPAVEVDLCGHATLAAAHVIFRHLHASEAAVAFETRSGRLTVTRDDELLTLDFPSRPATGCARPPELVDALGATPESTAMARDYLVVFPSEAAVRQLEPDMTRLMQLDGFGVIVTAPGESCDFISRFFAPKAGIPEDPVTGSAHCTLIPYWAERLGRNHLRARQISSRGGELVCELRADRVGIAGSAVTYASGFLFV